MPVIVRDYFIYFGICVGQDPDFDNLEICKSPHTVAALLKLYLRELPEPLLTFEVP